MSQLGDPIYDAIVGARVQLLFDLPFFGTLASRLILVEAPWCKTAATDGRHFYYNREFIKSLTKEELLFLCGHEVLHCVYDHLGRRGGRDPKLLNMAQDYVINYTLIEQQCGSMPKGGLYDKRFTDALTSEEVYEILKKESVTIQMTLDEHLDVLDQDPKDEDGDGDGQEGNGGKTVTVTVMGKNGPPKMTEADIEKIRAEIKASVIQAAQTVGAGSVPKGVMRMIDELINPKLDWRALLDAHIRSSVKDDYTFQRLSRKTSALRFAADEAEEHEDDDLHFEGEANFANAATALLDGTALTSRNDAVNKIIADALAAAEEVHDEDDDLFGANALPVPMLPTQDYMDTIDIMVAIDASGSMTEEMLRDQLSEVKGIMQTFRDFRVRILTFDTQIYDYKEFTAENIDEIDSYPMRGGGGTMFECVWEYMKREGIEPNRLVLFTDGLPNSTWGDENYVDTLFVIHTNTNIKAPWGITAYYEPKV